MSRANRQAWGATIRPRRSGLFRAWQRRQAAVGILALTLLGGVIGCESQQARPSGTRAVQLEPVEGYLEFVARRRRQAQESKVGSGNRRAKESIFEENVALETEGFVYHPNLLEFSAAGLFGLIQQSFREDFQDTYRQGGSDGTTTEYDIRGDFLKEKEYPGSVYARQSRTLSPRAFRSSVDTTTNSYGLIWQYLDQKLPAKFLLSHHDVKLEPLDPDELDGRQKNTTYRFDIAYNFSDDHHVALTYNHESVSEEPFYLDYDSDEVTLSHHIAFGDRQRHTLDSEIDYLKQSGSLAIEQIRWREILRMTHTDTLRSRLRLDARDRTRGSQYGLPPIEERGYFLTGLLEHRLYESLVTQANAFLHSQEYGTGAEIDEYGAGLGFDYRKRTPWGLLQAGYDVGIEREERGGGNQRVERIDESHTFRDPEPVTLREPGIDAGSILITASDRLTVYLLGQDYRVRDLVDRVEIERIPSGRIADGETVLIDYIVNLGGDFTLDTVRQDFSIRHDFETAFGLTIAPYYRLRWQHQSITPRSATAALPEDITGHLVGAEFRYGSFRGYGEYEDLDSSIDPYRAVRWNGTYSHRFRIGATGTVQAAWTNIVRHGLRPRETTFFTLDGSWRHPITRDLDFETALRYRNGDDSVRGDDEGIDFDVSLEWFYRQTELRLTYEYSQLDDDFTRNDSSTLYFQMKRRF